MVPPTLQTRHASSSREGHLTLHRQRRPVRPGCRARMSGTPRHAHPERDRGGPRLLGVLNVPPVGTNDAYTTPYENRLDIDTPGVLANDIDLDGDRLFTVLVTDTTHGSPAPRQGRQDPIQPDPGFSGVDHFTYRPFDGTSQALLPVTVTITVKPKPSADSEADPEADAGPDRHARADPRGHPGTDADPDARPTLVLPTLPIIPLRRGSRRPHRQPRRSRAARRRPPRSRRRPHRRRPVRRRGRRAGRAASPGRDRPARTPRRRRRSRSSSAPARAAGRPGWRIGPGADDPRPPPVRRRPVLVHARSVTSAAGSNGSFRACS